MKDLDCTFGYYECYPTRAVLTEAVNRLCFSSLKADATDLDALARLLEVSQLPRSTN